MTAPSIPLRIQDAECRLRIRLAAVLGSFELDQGAAVVAVRIAHDRNGRPRCAVEVDWRHEHHITSGDRAAVVFDES